MTNKVFNRYKDLAAAANVKRNTQDSLRWFRLRLRKDKPITDLTNVTEGRKNAKMDVGTMVTYAYDPKHKDKLAYYDSFPLIIVLETNATGWYGINLHYLPPALRANILYDIGYRNAKAEVIAKKLSLDKRTAPALKRYLRTQLMSPPKIIGKDEWEIAISLPFERFRKANNKQVWKDSRRKR